MTVIDLQAWTSNCLLVPYLGSSSRTYNSILVPRFMRKFEEMYVCWMIEVTKPWTMAWSDWVGLTSHIFRNINRRCGLKLQLSHTIVYAHHDQIKQLYRSTLFILPRKDYWLFKLGMSYLFPAFFHSSRSNAAILLFDFRSCSRQLEQKKFITHAPYYFCQICVVILLRVRSKLETFFVTLRKVYFCVTYRKFSYADGILFREQYCISPNRR